MFTYKGYTGFIEEIDVENGILCSCVLDIKDVITFHGKIIEEVRREFESKTQIPQLWAEIS
jgi:predicted HicB family RNase H-like nuclease